MSTENREPLEATGPVPAAPPTTEPPPAGLPPLRVLSGVAGRVLDRVRKVDWRFTVLILAAAVSVPVWRAATAHAKPHAGPVPTAGETCRVVVAKVTQEDLYNEVTIPAEFHPYLQVDLHAKVSGYVDKIQVDIGDRVKAGQLLAQLEVPELKDELDHAVASQQKAEADYNDAHLVYTRLVAVNKQHPNLVAQQDLDSAETKERTAAAALAGAKADVEKYQTLFGYTRITAPFDGVVTHRYADPGSLIQAGTASDTQSMPLVRLSDNYRLRLDFDVSVAYVKDVRIGDPVEVRVESLGGKVFTGRISRSTSKVDDLTRTMTTEIEVANPDLDLVPGMYATVLLKVDRRPKALTIPTEAVAKSTVYVVNGAQEIEERPVKLGLETATRLEVISGLKEGEMVLVGGRAQVKPGQKVEPKLPATLAKE